jgi:hypothetical protein
MAKINHHPSHYTCSTVTTNIAGSAAYSVSKAIATPSGSLFLGQHNTHINAGFICHCDRHSGTTVEINFFNSAGTTCAMPKGTVNIAVFQSP